MGREVAESKFQLVKIVRKERRALRGGAAEESIALS
jgi:hypothetical protein